MLLSISRLFLQTLILLADIYKFLQVPSCQKDETRAEKKLQHLDTIADARCACFLDQALLYQQ